MCCGYVEEYCLAYIMRLYYFDFFVHTQGAKLNIERYWYLMGHSEDVWRKSYHWMTLTRQAWVWILGIVTAGDQQHLHSIHSLLMSLCMKRQ